MNLSFLHTPICFIIKQSKINTYLQSTNLSLTGIASQAYFPKSNKILKVTYIEKFACSCMRQQRTPPMTYNPETIADAYVVYDDAVLQIVSVNIP